MEVFVQECLAKAVLQDQSAVKEAEASLKSIEHNSGYLECLLGVYENEAVVKAVRWMALICMKNTIEKYWRKGVKR